MNFPAHFESLKTALANWVDGDVAAYYLACCLGLMPQEDGSLNGFRDAKWVFCSGNPTGNELYAFLDKLVELGFLEFDGEEVRYRWNPAVQPNWFDNGGLLPNMRFNPDGFAAG
jgi:hypothetical protein